MASQGRQIPAAAWRCPVCSMHLSLCKEERRWLCASGHSFDVAREGYVNLLLAGQRRSRRPGDSAEMVAARRRFLGTGAYDPMSEAIVDCASREEPQVVLDVGCGEGRHTRALASAALLGVDVAKPAVAAAARAHPVGWYAVASAADLPLDDASIDAALCVFGPVFPAELARVVRPGGVVIAAHPGPEHLSGLRRMVYPDARPHAEKPPLRTATEWFAQTESTTVRFPVVVNDGALLDDLFAMTPYRWHAPPDIHARLREAAAAGFETSADVRVTTYRRLDATAAPRSTG